MKITKVHDGKKLTVMITGRMDSTTSPEADREMKDELEGVTELVVDFSSLDYISSAGLRLLLIWSKKMEKQGSMCLTGVSGNEVIEEIFENTGFDQILKIK